MSNTVASKIRFIDGDMSNVITDDNDQRHLHVDLSSNEDGHSEPIDLNNLRKHDVSSKDCWSQKHDLQDLQMYRNNTEGWSQDCDQNLAEMNQVSRIGLSTPESENKVVKRSKIAVKISPKKKMSPNLKINCQKIKTKNVKSINKKRQSSKIVNRMVDKEHKNDKIDKMIDAFEENVEVKKVDQDNTDDMDRKKDAFKYLMMKSKQSWGEGTTNSPRKRKVKRVGNKLHSSQVNSNGIMSWLKKEEN